MDKPQLLADTTHPESLAAIGTKQSLMKKAQQLMRRRGAGELKPLLADSVHGQSPDDPDSWYVLLAITLGQTGMEETYIFPEVYKKDSGRWWYLESPATFAILPQFQEFLERYEKDGPGPLLGQYDYGWLALPPRPLPPTAAADRPQWLSDDWPEDQKLGWVYLDTAKDPATGLTAAQTAAKLQKVMDGNALRDPQADYEAWYFRHGRFVE